MWMPELNLMLCTAAVDDGAAVTCHVGAESITKMWN